MRPEHNFKLTADAWADEVFGSATHFRMHRFDQDGKQDRAQCRTFAEAHTAAQQSLKDGYRVLIYAVASSGRSALLAPARWDHYVAQSTQKASGQPAA